MKEGFKGNLGSPSWVGPSCEIPARIPARTPARPPVKKMKEGFKGNLGFPFII
jgi:hypothetical protein